jgi:hypothetical protein
VFGGGVGSGTAALNAYAEWTFEGNVLAGANPSSYPPSNFYPAAFPQDIGFVDAANGDFRLSSSSSYKNRASDGNDPGVSFADLWVKTARAVSGLAEKSLGDFNGDGAIDAADYVVWRKTVGSQAGYDLWRTNFGRTAGSDSSLSTAVPDPSSIVLLLVAATLLLRMRNVRGWRS